MTTFIEIENRMQTQPTWGVVVSPSEHDQLDEEIKDVTKLIANSPSLLEAETFLDTLARMQSILATLAFRFKINMTDIQWSVIKKFDRWDVALVREKMFHAIKFDGFPGS